MSGNSLPESAVVQLEKKLARHLPEETAPIIARWVLKYRVRFIIHAPRKTKLGDFRPDMRTGIHTITINRDLNPYSFLVTTIHEFAHLLVWEKYGQKAAPHGQEWQKAYAWLLKGFLDRALFPATLVHAIEQYAMKPEASSCTNPQLVKALNQFNIKPVLYVDDLPQGATFQLGGKVFEKGIKLRKRYRCRLVNSNRIYLVHGLAEVELPLAQ